MDWKQLREAMPVTRRWAFFDHAAVAPITERARVAMNEYAADLAENGDVNERRWVDRVEEVRRLAGRVINADPLDVAFVKNTSEGIGIVAEGLPWQPGDNVVTAQEEYPANVYPWMNLQSRGVETRLVASRGPRLAIDDIRAAIDGRSRIVSLSFVEFASGFRNDIDAIGALCRERGVLFFVDAIQGLGVLPLDVQRSPVDFLAADGHKWLLGPEGAGVFYIRRELVDRLRPVGIGWNSVVKARDFSRLDFHLKPHAGRWESGSLNLAGITGLGASLALLLETGIEHISARVLELTDYLCEQARVAGFEVFSSRAPGDRSSIVSLIVPGAEPRAVVKHCRAAGIVINQRAGRVRVTPHCYNTHDEIDRLIHTLKVG
ncbi:aminotransferase class V [Planctomycetaceae bacterium SCGC AG-212-F19]|nr:aminotransferase class V [Planctomycetaceae bacterium SCGC AG-212-F19]